MVCIFKFSQPLIIQLTGKGIHIEDSALTEFDAVAPGKEVDLIYDVGDKNLGKEAADQIAKHLSHKTKLQELYLYNNNFKTIGMIKISKGLRNISSLRVFSIGCNHVGKEAADDVATVLSHNSRLKEIYLYNNNFKTAGMIKIAQALWGISSLTAFSVGENDVGEGAADDIALVLSRNTNLNQLHLHNNNFKTMGIIKIAKALQNISTLTIFSIGDNNINEEAAGDIGSVLSHNLQLKELYLHNNNFKTGGIIKIAKSLKNTVTLTVLSIGDNKVGDEAADDIATVLSHSTQLQELHLHNNNIQASGAIKITKALINTSTLVKFNISHNNIDGKTVSIVKNILSWNIKLNLCT